MSRRRPVEDLLYEAMEMAADVDDERAQESIAHLIVHATELRREAVRIRRRLLRRTTTREG